MHVLYRLQVTKEKILLIEQIFPTHSFAAYMYSHPGLLWEEMCKVSNNISSVEIGYLPNKTDIERIQRRINEANIVVMTNYYYHKGVSSISDIVRDVMAMDKKVIVVTNTPYAFGMPVDFPVGIVCFNPGGREQMRAVAQIIYGKLRSTAKLAFDVTTGKLTKPNSSKE